VGLAVTVIVRSRVLDLTTLGHPSSFPQPGDDKHGSRRNDGAGEGWPYGSPSTAVGPCASACWAMQSGALQVHILVALEHRFGTEAWAEWVCERRPSSKQRGLTSPLYRCWRR
jgi:hypothetical protein